MTSKELAVEIVKILDRKKAVDIKAVGIEDLTVLTDYFVIATGTSSTQVRSLADEIEFILGEKGIKPVNVEGYDTRRWILMDYGNVIVHIFYPEAREFYDLEHLWADGKVLDISEYLTPETDEQG